MKMFSISRPSTPAPRRFAASRASLAVTLALFGFQQAHATVECVGKVGSLILYQNGIVGVTADWNSAAFSFVCNTNGEFGGISTEVCLSWYATLMKAKSQNLNVTIYYDSNATCPTLPTYGSTPAVHYLGLY
jgi:hypothetical protein